MRLLWGSNKECSKILCWSIISYKRKSTKVIYNVWIKRVILNLKSHMNTSGWPVKFIKCGGWYQFPATLLCCIKYLIIVYQCLTNNNIIMMTSHYWTNSGDLYNIISYHYRNRLDFSVDCLKLKKQAQWPLIFYYYIEISLIRCNFLQSLKIFYWGSLEPP